MKKIFPFLLLFNIFVITGQNITWSNVSANYNMPLGVEVFSGKEAS
ncbi:MAG: hypothetical protein GZ087_05670 [Flavobacterium sp.]|nr:hypothetical protein [Flavobacterium sp.]